ncbi:MAG: hypothetical protein GC178_09945 [Flavobacteriales bacterium]|nr:hypothetical protein [Flavobacteriales bacterium]
MKRIFLLVVSLTVLSFSSISVHAQYIPYHTDHEDVYNFLSELRILGIVEYNPAVKPLSRKEIATMLWAADSSARLNKVQRAELDFWKQEFGKDLGTGKVHRTGKFFKRRTFDEHGIKKRLDLLYFANDLFQVTVNPIITGVGMINTDRDLRRFQNWGGEVFGRIGKGFGFYFSARDYLDQPNWNSLPNLSPDLGGVSRKSATVQNAKEYYEIRGGVTYGWKWGQVGILKDHLQLGSAPQDQIILSKRAPSFPRFHLQLKPIKWAELTYTFGWLSSDIVDSTRSYMTGNGVYREVYHPKFFVANLITVRPWKYLTFSLGSSVIVSDNNINAGHFIPIMFYNALDQSFNGQVNNAGQNSQVYADLNFDLFSWGQLYASILIDEIRLSTMFKPNEQRNSLGYQVGIRSRPFTGWNLKAYASYTRIRPGVYAHYIPTTTYAHANYGLGYFLGENSDAWVGGVQMRPLPKFRIIIEYQRWRRGPDVVFNSTPAILTGAKFMTSTVTASDRLNFRVRYQVINDVSVQLTVDYLKGYTDGKHLFPGISSGNVSSLWFGFGLNIGH